MKKYLKFAFVAAFAAIAGYSAYASQKADTMSDLALSNVEALASGESSNECKFCSFTELRICSDWGWGGCIGFPTAYYV